MAKKGKTESIKEIKPLVITVEVDEFWIETEHLDSDLKKHVIKEITNKIWNKIETRVDVEIAQVVAKELDSKMKSRLHAMVRRIFASGEKILKGRYSQDPKLSPDEYVLDRLHNSSHMNPKEIIDKRVEAFGKELKDRYDLRFASQVILNLDKQGMLKEGVKDAVLSGTNDK